MEGGMATEKEVQLAMREELLRFVSNITQLSGALATLSRLVEDSYLNSNLDEAVQVKDLARDLIARARK
jgi:hypothetical protein